LLQRHISPNLTIARRRCNCDSRKASTGSLILLLLFDYHSPILRRSVVQICPAGTRPHCRSVPRQATRAAAFPTTRNPPLPLLYVEDSPSAIEQLATTVYFFPRQLHLDRPHRQHGQTPIRTRRTHTHLTLTEDKLDICGLRSWQAKDLARCGRRRLRWQG
jgi:hypothetical protein